MSWSHQHWNGWTVVTPPRAQAKNRRRTKEVHHEQAQLKSEVVAVGFAVRVPALLVPLGGAALALDHAVNERHDDQRGVKRDGRERPTDSATVQRNVAPRHHDAGISSSNIVGRAAIRRTAQGAEIAQIRAPRRGVWTRFSVAQPAQIRERRARNGVPRVQPSVRAARSAAGPGGPAAARRDGAPGVGGGAARLPAATAAPPPFQFESERGTLHVRIRSAANLPAADLQLLNKEATSDPYVRLQFGSAAASGPSRCRRTSARCGARASASTASRCASCRTRRSASSCATRTRAAARARLDAGRRARPARGAPTRRACARRTRRSTSTS